MTLLTGLGIRAAIAAGCAAAAAAELARLLTGLAADAGWQLLAAGRGRSWSGEPW